MTDLFSRLNDKLPRLGAAPYWMATILVITSLLGCENENSKQWKEWQKEIQKVDYRCGRLGEYELKIKKTYLFFWPTYEGRSDWEPNGPPPLSCDAKLQSITIEVYWPGLYPAGNLTLGNDDNPDHIRASIRAVPQLERWDLAEYLKYKLNLDEDSSLDTYKFHQTESGLFTDQKKHRNSRFTDHTFYWETNERGVINTVIECQLSDNKKVNDCKQTQYIKKLQAVMNIDYQRLHLDDWKIIAKDIQGLLESNITIKGD